MFEVIVWPGWLGGLAIGVYMLLQLWLTGQPLGCSMSYGNLCGLVSRAKFFHRGDFASLNNWRLWFILGIPLGGAIAALTSNDGVWQVSFSMGEFYDRVLPQALWAKALVLMTGGALMGLGARLAGGCTSGHALTGLSLLNPASLSVAVLFFAGGTATVQVLFRSLGAV